MLQGEAVVQIWTLVIGAALCGPKLGTACSAPPVGDVLGDAFGEPVGLVDGDVWTPVIGPLPRLARTITPTAPSKITMTAATAAGISQAGRSDNGPPPPLGRWTEGRRAGADGGRRGAGAGAGSATDGIAATATPVPSGSAGTASPGFHVGCSIGVHVGWEGGRGGGAGSNGAGASTCGGGEGGGGSGAGAAGGIGSNWVGAGGNVIAGMEGYVWSGRSGAS